MNLHIENAPKDMKFSMQATYRTSATEQTRSRGQSEYYQVDGSFDVLDQSGGALVGSRLVPVVPAYVQRLQRRPRRISAVHLQSTSIFLPLPPRARRDEIPASGSE